MFPFPNPHIRIRIKIDNVNKNVRATPVVRTHKQRPEKSVPFNTDAGGIRTSFGKNMELKVTYYHCSALYMYLY